MGVIEKRDISPLDDGEYFRLSTSRMVSTLHFVQNLKPDVISPKNDIFSEVSGRKFQKIHHLAFFLLGSLLFDIEESIKKSSRKGAISCLF